MEKPIVLGVDIGGSHITAAIVDIEKGKLVQDSIRRSEVNSRTNKEDILTAWCEVINAALGEHKNSNVTIGIAMPGPFNYNEGISLIKDQDKLDALYGVNVKEELAKKLHLNPACIRLINDAAAFMKGEVFSGAAKGFDNVLGLTLGTGLGAAVSINGLAKDAALWNSEFKTGIAEDYLSSRWFVNSYETLTGKTVAGVKELAAIAEEDVTANNLFKEFGGNLSEFLHPILQNQGAEILILGGNIAQAFSLFSETLQYNLMKKLPNIIVKTSELNEYASLIGATIY